MGKIWVESTFLTNKEMKVLELFTQGESPEFIANALNVSRNRVYAILDALNRKKVRTTNTREKLQHFFYEKRKTKTRLKKMNNQSSNVFKIMVAGESAFDLVKKIATSFTSRPNINHSPLGIGRVQFDNPSMLLIVFSVESETHIDFQRYSDKMNSILSVSSSETEEGLFQMLKEATQF
ncbi:MAG: helix-turn-helix transcriptional regulator [Candidatus Hodarchaeales archaeon]|jgi:transcriptional regulator